MADVTERMLRLLSILQSGGAFSADHLGSRLGVSARTVRRDVDRLRGYGYPVDTRPGPGGFYRLTAGRTMPPLLLDDDEAVAVMLALATTGAVSSQIDERGRGVADAAATTYGKFEQFLPARLRPRAEAVRRAVAPPHDDAPTLPAGLFGLLSDAVAHRETVTITYVDGAGRTSERRVQPHGQAYHLLRWYLVAWDVGRDDWRVFRIDRIGDALRTGQRFAPRVLPAASVLDHVRAVTDRSVTGVRVTVDAPADVVVDALRYQEVSIVPVGDARCELSGRFDIWQWLVVNLAFLEADFRVLEPVEFMPELQRFARRLAAGVA